MWVKIRKRLLTFRLPDLAHLLLIIIFCLKSWVSLRKPCIYLRNFLLAVDLMLQTVCALACLILPQKFFYNFFYLPFIIPIKSHSSIVSILRSNDSFNKVNKIILKCRLSEWTVVPHELNARIFVE